MKQPPLPCVTNLCTVLFTGKEMTRSSTWWDASLSSQRARKTCCSGTARTTSASCIQPARTVRSSGWGRLRSSIMVLILSLYVHQSNILHKEANFTVSMLLFSDCRPNCKVGSFLKVVLMTLRNHIMITINTFLFPSLFSLYRQGGTRPV